MEILAYLPVLLFAIVIHEVAHAVVARWEGDDTAARAGRITLNPIPHLDLWGSIIIPSLLLISSSGFLFGWAKPVPIDPSRFRDRKWGDIRVSLAGIASNLLLALAFTLLAAVLLGAFPARASGGGVTGLIVDMAEFGILINLILAVFNLAPIPPLDGSHVVYQLLPRKWGETYRQVGRYGLVVLFLAVFIFPRAFDVILWPVDALMGLAYDFIDLWQ